MRTVWVITKLGELKGFTMMEEFVEEFVEKRETQGEQIYKITKYKD